MATPQRSKKVYAIHENTKGTMMFNSPVEQVTGYVVAACYLSLEETAEDEFMAFTPLYNDKYCTSIMNQVLRGVYFETYEEGKKALTRFLKFKTMHYKSILEDLEKLAEEYPEEYL